MDEIFKAEAWEKLWTYRSTFLTGFGNTLRTAAAALVLALLLGFLFGLMASSRRRLLRAIARIYVECIQNTPVVLQMCFLYYARAFSGVKTDIIATGIAGGLCMAGSPFGPLLFLLIFNAVNIALRCLGVKYGYGLGENIISKVSDPSTMQKLTCALSIVGLMVIGGMIATNVAITTPIAFDISGTAFSLQDTLDSIFPKLLPVAAFGIPYALNKKGVNVLVQIIAIMVLGVVLGAVGILG